MRRLKPERLSGSLRRRADDELTFVESARRIGPPLLLDTCVYVDQLEGTAPAAVDALLKSRVLVHLSVCLAELSHNFGRLDPGHPQTAGVLRELRAVFADIPPHRIEDDIRAGLLVEAGILAGLVYRLGGFQRGQEVAALNDATIFLHALEKGYTVLTRNIRDFDFLGQMMPAGRVLLYRV